MVWTIEDAHLDLAIETVAKHATKTALVPAPAIHPRAWLKLENQQHTGSFKVRGALTKLATLGRAERSAGVVTASAGNHGLGVAYAAGKLGISARVFVPSGVARVKRDGIAAFGASVVVTDHAGYDETEKQALAWAEAQGATYISAYDDPHVAAGNGGTVGLEILGAMPNLDAIVCPVGGGGLIAGLAAAIGRSGRPVRLIGLNTDASPGMARSFELGRAIEEMPPADTVAEGLEGGVRASTYQAARDGGVEMEVVADENIAPAMLFARDVLGTRVEGSAAIAIAWAQQRLGEFEGTDAVVIVVSGGNTDAL